MLTVSADQKQRRDQNKILLIVCHYLEISWQNYGKSVDFIEYF